LAQPAASSEQILALYVRWVDSYRLECSVCNALCTSNTTTAARRRHSW